MFSREVDLKQLYTPGVKRVERIGDRFYCHSQSGSGVMGKKRPEREADTANEYWSCDYIKISLHASPYAHIVLRLRTEMLFKWMRVSQEEFTWNARHCFAASVVDKCDKWVHWASVGSGHQLSYLLWAQVTLRPPVSRSWCRVLLGAHCQISFFSCSVFRHRMASPTRGCICHLSSPCLSRYCAVSYLRFHINT
jgi:hypothetical protein